MKSINRGFLFAVYVLLVILVIGCDKPTTNSLTYEVAKRFEIEVEEFCACHEGLSALSYNPRGYIFTCKDGVQISGSAPLNDEHFYPKCK